ncbi:hypothetical protein [Chitinophaga rhizosphaerae]|uniref:hypothetical protein n=1 Tax=Chitinophaga rhizosphaerae TaxID=1864947 RepID=UPI001F0C139C|nr:hypothetical protein [Chitinophaga rhizosphaerae]
MRSYTLFLVCLLSLPAFVAAQDSLLAKAQAMPDKYLQQVTGKSEKYQRQVERRTRQALDRMMRQEKKLQAKLMKVDSLAAKNLFTNSLDSLRNLQGKLKSKTQAVTGLLNGQTGGYLDTLTNTLGFLKDAKGLLGKAGDIKGKLGKSMDQVKSLQDKLKQAEQVRNYIRERRNLLKSQLGQYANMTKDLQKINKEAYYYAQQLKEYQSVFSDRKKAEAKAMELLQKLPAYKDFMARNSQIARLFNLASAGDGNVEQQLEGLQTRAQVEQLIQQRLGGGGPNASQAIRQQMDAARSQMDELKKHFPDLDNAAEMPDFKPNEMKTKSFLSRLEFGANVQFQRSNQFFPSTGDFAGQVGYRFSKNGIVGMGASYKLGMGTGFNNIRFSHQGMGVRSFADYKLKGTFFVNGGFEYNYNAAFANPNQLANAKAWTRSALLGIAKKYKINNKLKGNMTLLYDFLHNSQVPRTDPVKFRVGYNF